MVKLSQYNIGGVIDVELDTDKKSGKAKTIWLILVILLLIISNTVWGLLWYNQNTTKTGLETKNSKLNSDNSKLSDSVKSLKAANEKAKVDSSTQWRDIPEFGVKYKLDSDTKNLSYSYAGGKDGGTISWSSIALSNKSTDTKGCNSFDGAVMSWSKTNSPFTTKNKQVGSQKIYQITPDGGDGLRAANCQDKTLLDAVRTAEGKAFDSLQPIN